jgi:two-component system, OmpR family, KDP operon response regulator KdpE
VALRRSQKTEDSPVFQSGNLKVDLVSRIILVNETEVKLTVTEYAILALLIKHAGRVLTHNFMVREIWGIHYTDNYQTLRVHIAQLRRKIESNPSVPQLIQTEPGVGYRLKIT